LPRNKYPEETVKKILDTSLQLFLEKGFEQTTVLDIVDNLGGLTRGAFYHHFKSKEEVLDAIFQRDFNENNPFDKAENAAVSNGLERLKFVLKRGLKTSGGSEQRMAVSNVAHSLLSNPRFLAEHLKDIQKDAERMTPIIEEGMADGSIKQGNPRLVAELFMLLANVWMMPNIFPCEKEATFEKIDIIEQIFKGLGYHFIDEELGGLFREMFRNFLDKLES